MLQVKAYAKINLGLRVLFKRPDGYHELETVFHRVNVSDTITISPCSMLKFSTADSLLAGEDSNLCLRAGKVLLEYCKKDLGAKIALEKNIPIGAGLGGGSSDAATTLLGLNTFWKLGLSIEELLPLAVSLGSDVPYFLRNDSAYATGRGEKLTYFHLEVPYWIVLVYPNIHVSTVWAYKRFNITQPKSITNYHETLQSEMVNGNNHPLIPYNDFEDMVFPEYPVIGEVKNNLLNHGAVFAQMSGSGSSVYGLFADEKLARTAIAELGKEYRVFLTEPAFKI